MQRLEPNTGDTTMLIYKNHVFVAITDYGLVYILREIRVRYGEVDSKWIWIPLKENVLLTIGSDERDNEYRSFDRAINRWVNDPYCTVYDFETYQEMFEAIKNSKLEYKDTIATVYKGKEEQ